MSDTARLIEEAAHRLFTQHVTPELLHKAESGFWPADLWDAVEEAGFLDALTDADTAPLERATNTAALLRAASRHLAPIPFAETVFARAILAAKKVKAPKGPLSFAVLDGHTHRHGDHAHLKGIVHRVAFGRHVPNLIVAADDGAEAVLIATRRGTRTDGTNIAGEPRDDVAFTDTAGATVPGMSSHDLLKAGAAMRAIGMAGALDRILLQTVDYARTRVQFGKPIASFQAIQQQLAVLAGHVAAVGLIATKAITDFESPDLGELAAAVAKIRAGQAVSPSCSIAHQVHGAIGITKEHSLHFATRRLWSWRAEFGTENFWAARLGRSAAKMGHEAFWERVTA